MNENNKNSWTPVGTLPDHKELKSSRFKFIWLFLICALFAIGGFWAFSAGVREGWVWGCMIFFGLGALLFLVMIFKPHKLILSRQGFEQNVFGRTTFFNWNEVSEFSSLKVTTGLFNTQRFVNFSRLEDEGKLLADVSKKLLGGSISLADNFGMKTKNLAELMNTFRARAILEGDEESVRVDEARLVSSSARKNSWQPVNDGPESTSYTPGDERKPWVKWILSFLLLALVATAAIWLISQTVVNDDLPADRPRIELPTTGSTDKAEEPVPPKSADEQAWIDALEKDTLEGYREYLTNFPNGRHKDKAQEEINAYDNKAWASAEQRNTIAGYEDYLENWPEGLHAAKAQERIDEMKAAIEAANQDAAERAAQEARDWKTAETANSLQSYQDYLGRHPSGKHAGEAQSRINAIQAAAVAAEASQIEEAAWSSAKTSNTVSGYETYLSSYPQGKYAPLAKAALEDLKPSPGKTFRDCDVCPLMVTVPSGNANLGAGADEPDVRPNEQPQRPVIIGEPFSIGVTEVTFSQWQACAAAGGCPSITNDNGWGGGKRPVINVSWDNAQKYTGWLSSKTGKNYSLPSESQWEYAARGGDTGLYAGGSKKALCAFANGAGKESGLAWANTECNDLSSDRTLPAGSLSGNKYGLKDTIGNVAEWTLDCNTLNLKDAPTDGSPDLRGSCNQRAVRGGSWFSPPADLRYGARLMQRRGDSNDFTGLRVVRK